MKKNVSAIILAAGKGTRMRSELPKVLHPVCGRPMLGYVTDVVKALKLRESVVVLGHGAQEVKQFLGTKQKVVLQKQLRGTADAVKQAIPLLKNTQETVIVLYGDTPLLTKETIAKLIKHHQDTQADATLLTAVIDNPSGYGRILRDDYKGICAIIEEKDANDFQKDIKEINTGIVCFNKRKLIQALKKVKPNNLKKEYYLTDTIGILYKWSGLIESLRITDINESLGVNSRIELAEANSIMQKRINTAHMKEGVAIAYPETVFISHAVKIGRDTTIYPFTVIENNVTIGKSCAIGPFVRIAQNTIIKDKQRVVGSPAQ